jgi:hypothetical protein
VAPAAAPTAPGPRAPRQARAPPLSPSDHLRLLLDRLGGSPLRPNSSAHIHNSLGTLPVRLTVEIPAPAPDSHVSTQSRAAALSDDLLRFVTPQLGPLGLRPATISESQVQLTAFISSTTGPNPFATRILADGGFNFHSPAVGAAVHVTASQPNPEHGLLDLGDCLLTFHNVPFGCGVEHFVQAALLASGYPPEAFTVKAEMGGTPRVHTDYRGIHRNAHVVKAIVRMADPADHLCHGLATFGLGAHQPPITHRVEFCGDRPVMVRHSSPLPAQPPASAPPARSSPPTSTAVPPAAGTIGDTPMPDASHRQARGPPPPVASRAPAAPPAAAPALNVSPAPAAAAPAGPTDDTAMPDASPHTAPTHPAALPAAVATLAAMAAPTSPEPAGAGCDLHMADAPPTRPAPPGFPTALHRRASRHDPPAVGPAHMAVDVGPLDPSHRAEVLADRMLSPTRPRTTPLSAASAGGQAHRRGLGFSASAAARTPPRTSRLPTPGVPASWADWVSDFISIDNAGVCLYLATQALERVRATQPALFAFQFLHGDGLSSAGAAPATSTLPAALFPAVRAALAEQNLDPKALDLFPRSYWDSAAAVRPGCHLPFAVVQLLKDARPNVCGPDLPAFVASWTALNAPCALGPGAPLRELPEALVASLLLDVDAWEDARPPADPTAPAPMGSPASPRRSSRKRRPPQGYWRAAAEPPRSASPPHRPGSPGARVGARTLGDFLPGGFAQPTRRTTVAGPGPPAPAPSHHLTPGAATRSFVKSAAATAARSAAQLAMRGFSAAGRHSSTTAPTPPASTTSSHPAFAAPAPCRGAAERRGGHL